jgi:phospholipase C
MFATVQKALLSAFIVFTASACSQSGPIGGLPQPVKNALRTHATAGLRSKIQHVVIIIQENRSFDNIFAGYPGADAPTYGYMSTGKRVNLKARSFGGSDLAHGYKPALVDYDNGKMDGFDLNSPYMPKYPYSYLKRAAVKPYWTMAQQYVLADQMFPTELGGSFAAHLNLIAGTDQLSPGLAEADNPSDTPWGCDAPPSTESTTVNSNRQISIHGPFPCFTQFKTMADILDPANVSWKYYAPQTFGCPTSCDGGGLIWSEFDAISNVRYGPDWAKDVINPQTTILGDAANGNLAAVSWVVPDWKDSDHALSDSDTGPSWVAAVVNAIGKSKYWKSTAIVVLWDDWGGWYDDAAPPQLDWEGLAIRVPCIIISPYAKAATVSHTQYESGSILKFIEETFNLPSLGYTDARATSISDSFDFTQKARGFKKIPAKYPPPYFQHERPSFKSPDNE